MKNKITWKRSLVLIFQLFIYQIFIYQYAFALEVTAKIEYLQVEQLTLPVTGVVKQDSPVGVRQEKGGQLAAFDSTVIDSKIKVLNLSKQLKQKVLAEAKRELQRSEELYEGTMLSDHELKKAEIAHLKAENELANVQHQIIKARWKRKFYRLKAPYNGFIVASHIYPGKYIANRYKGTPLMDYVVGQAIDIRLQLNQKIALNDGAKFRINYAGVEYQAVVSGVNHAEGQGILYARIDSPGTTIPPQNALVKVIE